jgi:hypothetical protein
MAYRSGLGRLAVIVFCVGTFACDERSSPNDDRKGPDQLQVDQSGSPASTQAYFGFFPSASGADFKRFKHNILGFEIDMPASWTFGIVGSPPLAVAWLYPEGTDTAHIGPNWNVVEVGRLPPPSVSLEDAMAATLVGLRTKHPDLEVTSATAPTLVGELPSVVSTISWRSKSGFVVTEIIYIVQFGADLRSLAIRWVGTSQADYVSAAKRMVQSYVPTEPSYQ